MSLFSYIDTRAPSTEEIMNIEAEYDDDGNPIEPSWTDKFELQTEFSLQRLSSLFGTLSVIVALIGTFLSGWFAVSMADGKFSAYSALVLVVGLIITAVAFGLMRLAKAFVSYMLVRLLQTEEE